MLQPFLCGLEFGNTGKLRKQFLATISSQEGEAQAPEYMNNSFLK
jgi:hypothetical protein